MDAFDKLDRFVKGHASQQGAATALGISQSMVNKLCHRVIRPKTAALIAKLNAVLGTEFAEWQTARLAGEKATRKRRAA